VHDDLAVRELTLILADRLDLPTKLSYQLLNLQSGEVLKPNLSLARAGVAAGAELQLRPVRDKAFDSFVDVLESEIKTELKGEARRRARDVLGRLLAGEIITEAASAAGQTATDTAASAAGAAAAEQVVAQATSNAADASAAQSQVSAGSGQTGSAQSHAPAGNGPASQPAARSRPGCLKIGCIGVSLLTVAAVGAGILFFDEVVQPMITQIEPLISQIAPGLLGSHPAEPALGSGDVQVTLRWDNPVDMDLHVFDPSGEEIWFGNTESASGGQLDVDSNAFCSGDYPVENVYWPTGDAPFGTYEVYVRLYQSCNYVGASAYSVTLLVDGVSYGPYEGVFDGEAGESQFVTGFER
jgi:hypothetical protein